MPEASRSILTFRFERWRALSSGILESAGTTFLLLIAVRWFHAGATSKAIVAAGASVGLLLSPLVVSQVERLRWPIALAASRLAAIGAVSFLLAALFPVLPVFTLCVSLGMAASAAGIPLMTQIYQENYPEKARGRLFSQTFMIRIATAAGFSYLAGRALSGQMEKFPALLLVFSLSFAFASFCFRQIPSGPLHNPGASHPFRGLRYVRDDLLFRRTLICWMLMGFANLMMLPLRIEFLANPAHGRVLTAATIALLTGVIPNIARLVLSPVGGWLFDHMNFFTLRVTLNIGFALAILTFFTSDTLGGMALGAVIFGISNAGGDVAWSLWVTKFAPPQRVADYMSVHTFFTGVRGVLAPMAAFQLAIHFSIGWIGVFSALLIVAATALLLPEIKFGKKGKPAARVIEELPD